MLNPIYLDEIEKNISVIKNNNINIAFTGGAWRIKDFKKILIDVLNNISIKTDVTLYLPKNRELKDFFAENKKYFSPSF